MSALHKKRRIRNRILLEEEVAEEDMEGRIIEARGENITKEEGLTFIAYGATEMDMMLPHVSSLGTGSNGKGMKRKENHQIKGKVKHPNPLTILWHIAISK